MRWEVYSFTKPDKVYTVALFDKGIIECSCPDWIYRHGKYEYYKCKHIEKVVRENVEKITACLILKGFDINEIQKRVVSDRYSVEELADMYIKELINSADSI
jgi:hypothetical protein